MRKGFTTGSCAAAAAKAAVWMLLGGKEKTSVEILTPAGIPYKADVTGIVREEEAVSCAVIKDGGDDPDVTTGMEIRARAVLCGETAAGGEPEVRIEGGEGIGTVTRPGLDRRPGEAAINSVPRAMIEKEVREVLDAFDCSRDVVITISAPGGEEVAKRTYNERLGITGGISIIGTSGIVEPMSTQAILDTIRLEIRQQTAEGHRILSVTPGNYGLRFMKETYGFDLDWSVKCSNFIGAALDMAAEAGAEGILLTGHSGKLVKVAGGIMNTHSREGDCRMELIAASAIRAGMTGSSLTEILDAMSTEEAFRVTEREGKTEAVAGGLMRKILFNLRKRASASMRVECMMYANEFGLLAASEGADEYIRIIKEQKTHGR